MIDRTMDSLVWIERFINEFVGLPMSYFGLWIYWLMYELVETASFQWFMNSLIHQWASRLVTVLLGSFVFMEAGTRAYVACLDPRRWGRHIWCVKRNTRPEKLAQMFCCNWPFLDFSKKGGRLMHIYIHIYM